MSSFLAGLVDRALNWTAEGIRPRPVARFEQPATSGRVEPAAETEMWTGELSEYIPAPPRLTPPVQGSPQPTPATPPATAPVLPPGPLRSPALPMPPAARKTSIEPAPVASTPTGLARPVRAQAERAADVSMQPRPSAQPAPPAPSIFEPSATPRTPAPPDAARLSPPAPTWLEPWQTPGDQGRIAVERLIVKPNVEPAGIAQAPAAERQRAAKDQPPVIHVSIGRIEVRAGAQPAAQPRPPSQASTERLEDYLRSRKERP